MEHKSGVLKSQVFRVEVSEIDPFIIYNGEEYPGTSMVLPRGASFSLYANVHIEPVGEFDAYL